MESQQSRPAGHPSDPSTFANFQAAREACISARLMGVVELENITRLNGTMIASGRQISVRGFQTSKEWEERMLATQHAIPIDLKEPEIGIRGKPVTEGLFEKIRQIVRSAKWRTGRNPDIVLVIEKDGFHKEIGCGNARFAIDRLIKIDRNATVWIEVRDCV